MTVDDDGNARLTRFYATFQVPMPESKVAITFVGVDAVNALVADSSALGAGILCAGILCAGILCDDDSQAQDAPPRVLTLLRDSTDTRGHAFRWLSGGGVHGAVSQRVDAFIQASFPGI